MRILIGISCLLLALSAYAQDPTPPAGLEGQSLRTWLKSNWHSPYHNDLGYSQARIAMFGTIDNEGGQVEGVYTGYTQAAEAVSFLDPINTEHTVPQSFFDGASPMKSDLHHLFPTHMQANSDRGNLPFGEVPDNQTDDWYYSNGSNYISTGNTPGSNIDDYSERDVNVAFEPREEQKGNTARAIFYFYTMYPNELEPGSDDINDAGDLATLYEWHVMDPPDAQEIERDEQIQAEQGNYNPYVRMPELVAPAWGFVSSVEEFHLDFELIIRDGIIRLRDSSSQLDLELIDLLGQSVAREQRSTLMSAEGLPRGIYFLQATDSEGRTGTQKILIQ